MRILHLIHSEGLYGAERILLYLAREQQLRGHAAVVGSMRDPGTPAKIFAHVWTKGLFIFEILLNEEKTTSDPEARAATGGLSGGGW